MAETTLNSGVRGLLRATSPNKEVADFAHPVRFGGHGSESRAGNS